MIQEEFTTSVAELVVGKLQAVSSVAKGLTVLHQKPHNPIMGRINALLEQGLAAAPALPAVAGLAEGEKSKLQPRALTLDGDGRVVSAHEEHLKRNPEVELIPWKSWLRYRQDDNFSKALAAFQEAMLNEQDRAMELPLAILRQGTQVLVQTTKDIGRGELLVPVHFSRPTSVLNAAGAKAKLHDDAVSGSVTWAVPEMERAAGVEETSYTVALSVLPEQKLPKKKDGGEFDWQMVDAVHPFWHIKRQSVVTEIPNMELTVRQVSVIVAGETAGEAFTVCRTASLPFLTNPRPIKAGEDLLLSKELAKAKPEKPKKPRTFADDLVEKERKKCKSGRPS